MRTALIVDQTVPGLKQSETSFVETGEVVGVIRELGYCSVNNQSPELSEK